MPLTHQTARWLDEPTKPLGQYRYIDQLSTPQLACCILGVLCGLGVFLLTTALWPLCVPLAALVASGIGAAGYLAFRGRREPYLRQVAGYAMRVLARRARVTLTRPVVVVAPVIDARGIVESAD